MTADNYKMNKSCDEQRKNIDLYKGKDKENTLKNMGRDLKYITNNHVIVRTNNPNELFTGPGYENLKMKVLMNDPSGYRLYCEVKKGNIEYPHYHCGKYELFMLYGKILYKNEETGEEVILEKGDYYYNPPYVRHSSICLEDCAMLWMYDKEPDCQNCTHN